MASGLRLTIDQPSPPRTETCNAHGRCYCGAHCAALCQVRCSTVAPSRTIPTRISISSRPQWSPLVCARNLFWITLGLVSVLFDSDVWSSPRLSQGPGALTRSHAYDVEMIWSGHDESDMIIRFDMA